MTGHGDWTPAPRWRNYAVSYGTGRRRQRDLWCGEAEAQRLLEGMRDESVEFRSVRGPYGTMHQWRDRVE